MTTERKAPLCYNRIANQPADHADLRVRFNGVAGPASDWHEVDVLGMWGVRTLCEMNGGPTILDDDMCERTEKVYGTFELSYAPPFPGTPSDKCRSRFKIEDQFNGDPVDYQMMTGHIKPPLKFGDPVEVVCEFCDNSNLSVNPATLFACRHMVQPRDQATDMAMLREDEANYLFSMHKAQRAIGYVQTNPSPDGWVKQMFTATEESRRQERRFGDDVRGFIKHTMYALMDAAEADVVVEEISDGAIHQCMIRGMDARTAAGQVLLGLVRLGSNADWQSRRVDHTDRDIHRRLKNDPRQFAEMYGTMSGRWPSSGAHIEQREAHIEQREARIYPKFKAEIHVVGNAKEQLAAVLQGLESKARVAQALKDGKKPQ